MGCDSADVMTEGFGDTFIAAEETIGDMNEGLNVKMQYKVEGDVEALDYTPVEELRQATIHEVEQKSELIHVLFTVVAQLMAFTFIIVFKSAYDYNNKYLSDIKFDNNFITGYFRHIDARRRAQGKTTLLPLKKFERKNVIFPNSVALVEAEKSSFGKGTLKLVLRVVISAVICYMDSLLFQILDLISRNSRVEYRQTGEHTVNIQVEGLGFMGSLVRGFLTKLNSRHTLDRVTTNHACLPKPSETDDVITAFIFAIYVMVWLFIYFEDWGLRLRHVIAAFFYRKREKKRVLALYNEMYRKRLGYLKHMRKKIRKQLRKREMKNNIGVVVALQRQFPYLCRCLSIFKSAKKTCIICDDTERRDFYRCDTEGCGVIYCPQCWKDIKRKCYACDDVSDESDDDDDSSLLDEDD